MERVEPLIRDVSDTALWVAAYRAEESERRDALFHDPYARRLAGQRGLEIARRVKQQAVRWAVVVRTAVLDELVLDAVRERGFDTVLNLAAGLDSRPYRLDLPAGLRWVEADLPALLDHKDRVLGSETPRCSLERVPLDLAERDSLAALLERTRSRAGKTLVVTEGLLGYLPPADVALLAGDLRAGGAEEWLTDLIGGNVGRRLKGAGDELKASGSRVVFAPAEGTGFFRPHGWTEGAYHDLLEEGRRLGRLPLTGRVFRMVMRWLPEARRASLERGVGVVRLERG